ncbi:MAG: hypothetical protein J6Y43_08415, partial [Clostridia bacterium]|nr:hypothetical protein [Clostridia bacterium]
AGKISNGNLLPKDCVALSKSLAVIPNLKFQLSGIENGYVSDIIEKLSDYSDVVSLLERAVADEGESVNANGAKGKVGKPEKYIKDGYNK